jgi:hypothetical protein
MNLEGDFRLFGTIMNKGGECGNKKAPLPFGTIVAHQALALLSAFLLNSA